MTEISLTDFVDFIGRTGTSRLAQVRDLKRRADYHPKRDYYKDARDAIREALERNGGEIQAKELLERLIDNSKRLHYEAVFTGYRKFVGKRRVAFFDPPYSRWKHSDLSIRINPELGLTLDGTRYAIKLYFKSEPLSKAKAELITHTMEKSLRSKADKDTIMGVLDMRRGKLYAPTVPIPGVDALLVSEAMAFLHLWNELWAEEASKIESRKQRSAWHVAYPCLRLVRTDLPARWIVDAKLSTCLLAMGGSRAKCHIPKCWSGVSGDPLLVVALVLP